MNALSIGVHVLAVIIHGAAFMMAVGSGMAAQKGDSRGVRAFACPGFILFALAVTLQVTA